MKTIFKILLGVIIVVIFAGTIVFLYNKSKPKPVVFVTKSPEITNIIKKTVATGSVVPRREIEIKPKVSGIIEELYIEPGKKIRKGERIARIRIIPNMVSLNAAESRVSRAKIALDNAKVEYDRYTDLLKSKVIPAAEFQKYELSYRNAKEELNDAENNLDLIKEGQTKQTSQSTNTVVTSTLDGMVLAVPVEQGKSVIESNTFNDGTTIATVADMGEMIFKGKVDETEVGKIREGMNLILTIGAIETDKFDATLEHISPKGTLENGAIQFEIKAMVTLKENVFVRSGYSANADIVLDRRDSVLAISESVLQFDKEKPFVEVETATPQVFEKRMIKTGLSDGINIEVLEGLKKTDKIKVPGSQEGGAPTPQ
jgi:HlyD family secretion protein